MLRISVRIDLTVGALPVAMADLALPAGSSLADILDEVLELTGAPQISRPWVARTAAGTPVDAGIPLARTQLEQGGVLVLSPNRELPAPVVRDAAEALVELSARTRARGLLEVLSAAGLLMLGLLLAGPALAALHPALRLLILLAGCVLILFWLPRGGAPLTRSALPVLIIMIGALAAAVTVSGPRFPEGRDLAWTLLGTALGALAATVLVHLSRCAGLLTCATATTVSLLLLVFAGATAIGVDAGSAADPRPSGIRDRAMLISGPAAATLGVCMILISLAPNLAAQFAGLRVPTLPSAGQDLAVSDTGLSDPTLRAGRARILLNAQLLGVTLLGVPLLLSSAAPATWAGTLFLVCVAVAALLHAIRHHDPLATWALMVLACCAAVAAVASASRQDSLWVLPPAVLIAVATVTVTLWVPRLPVLEPTTVQWLERLESLCVALSLPLALHLLGVFGMLAGLDISLGR